MQFFKDLSPENFREFMAVLITIACLAYLFLPSSMTDPTTRGAMTALLGTVIKHYFDSKTNKTNEGLIK